MWLQPASGSWQKPVPRLWGIRRGGGGGKAGRPGCGEFGAGEAARPSCWEADQRGSRPGARGTGGAARILRACYHRRGRRRDDSRKPQQCEACGAGGWAVMRQAGGGRGRGGADAGVSVTDREASGRVGVASGSCGRAAGGQCRQLGAMGGRWSAWVGAEALGRRVAAALHGAGQSWSSDGGWR